VRERLENYGSVLRDCAAVIAANPRTPKAYYRAGLALIALEREEEALDVCTRGCECVADDVELMARCEEVRQREAEQRERARRANEERQRMMDFAFAVRSLPTIFNFNALNLICGRVVRGCASTGTEPHRSP
jgi:hypothetical protein